MALPTLDDFKAHLNLEQNDSSQDDELGIMLAASCEVVEGLIGPLAATAVTEHHRNVSSDVLVLRRMPVQALTGVTSVSSGVESAQTVEDFDLDAATGLLRAAAGSWLHGNFAVTYTVGRDNLPASVHLAILIIAAHLYETQTRPGFTSAVPAGFGGADGVPDSTVVGRGYAIPHRAEELLRRYLQTAIA